MQQMLDWRESEIHSELTLLDAADDRSQGRVIFTAPYSLECGAGCDSSTESTIAGKIVHASLPVRIMLSSVVAVACRDKYKYSSLSQLAALWILSMIRKPLLATCSR